MFSLFGRMTARLILAAAYGVDIRTKEDPHVVEADALMRMLTTSAVPSSYLVNSVPALIHVPEWMPGASSSIPGQPEADVRLDRCRL